MLLLQANIIKLLINITLGCWQNVWNDSDIFHIGEIKKQKNKQKPQYDCHWRQSLESFCKFYWLSCIFLKSSNKKNTIKQNKAELDISLEEYRI